MTSVAAPEAMAAVLICKEEEVLRDVASFILEVDEPRQYSIRGICIVRWKTPSNTFPKVQS
jgi:hypothetical protein